MRNERSLQTAVLKWLGTLSHGVWENRSPSPWGTGGVPDLGGCVCGRYAVIELKNPNDHREPRITDKRWAAQRFRLRQIYKNGGCALATNNLAAVQAFITEIVQHVDDNGISHVSPMYVESFL